MYVFSKIGLYTLKYIHPLGILKQDSIEKGSPESIAPIYLLRTKTASSKNGKNKQKDFEFQTETLGAYSTGNFITF